MLLISSLLFAQIPDKLFPNIGSGTGLTAPAPIHPSVPVLPMHPPPPPPRHPPPHPPPPPPPPPSPPPPTHNIIVIVIVIILIIITSGGGCSITVNRHSNNTIITISFVFSSALEHYQHIDDLPSSTFQDFRFFASVLQLCNTPKHSPPLDLLHTCLNFVTSSEYNIVSPRNKDKITSVESDSVVNPEGEDDLRKFASPVNSCDEMKEC